MKPPHFSQKSPYGWWIASYIVRFEFYDEDKKNNNRRCTAWENTVLIVAADREEAYQKALACGRSNAEQEAWQAGTGRKGKWRFEGLTNLLPIYEELEDGAEILWKDHSGRSVRKIKALVRRKDALQAFAGMDTKK